MLRRVRQQMLHQAEAGPCALLPRVHCELPDHGHRRTQSMFPISTSGPSRSATRTVVVVRLRRLASVPYQDSIVGRARAGSTKG